MSEQDNIGGATAVEVVQRCYGHIAQGEWALANALLSDDFTQYEPPSLEYGGEWRGNGAMQRLFERAMAYWADPDIKIKHMLGDDAHCIALMEMSMTSKKTGERFTQNVVEVLRVKDGKITELQVHYFDTAPLSLG
ncbi:MAG TPA: nuclear transport factor 2 family protein [Sphingobium sp.]